IGDFIQCVPVINGLRAQFPVRRLDVLTHKPVRALAPMVTGVDDWWTIDRDALQEGLGRREIPLLTSFQVLKERLDEINARDYDGIVNLSQTYFSAWIAGYLSSRGYTGLVMDVSGEAQIHSAWFQYLNEKTEPGTHHVFHHSDIFFHGAGLLGPK